MLKIRKLAKGFQEAPVRWLDEGWVDALLEDWKRQAKVTRIRAGRRCLLLVNMSASLNNVRDVVESESKESRIKFKGDLSSGHHLPESRLSIKSAITFTNSGDFSDILDSKTCFHPQCSFAYNITGDVRSPSFVTECLPPDTCDKLGAIWGFEPIKRRGVGNVCKMKNAEEENEAVEEFIRSVERDLGIRSDLSEDLQVNPKSSEGSPSPTERGQFQRDNPYLKFLKKTGGLGDLKRKKNLGRKAGKITKLIIQKFLEWYQSLGGNDDETFLEESTLENLFQIGFDMPAAKSLAIRTQELPTIPECLAVLINEPEHSPKHCLRQFLKQDMKLEKIPPKMFAFGRMLPKEKPSLRYKPPKNFVRKTWMECSRVPSDLDSMETVWGGLQKLRSTIAFSNWLKNHPEIKPPTYLEAQGLLKINYEEWNQMYKGFEVDVDAPAESLPSDTKLAKEKISVEGSRGSSLKMDSYESIL